jgi:hypothetical protein
MSKSVDEQRRDLLHAARLRAIDAAMSAGVHNVGLRQSICQAESEQEIAAVLAEAGVIAPSEIRSAADALRTGTW